MKKEVKKYFVDIFASQESIKTECPDNSYFVEDLNNIPKIIYNCARKISGIKKVEIWFNEDRKHEYETIKVNEKINDPYVQLKLKKSRMEIISK